jgi:transposase-like protein
MKRTLQVFPDEFKLKVAREYMETEMSQVALLEKYNIRSSSSITNWVRKFGLMPEPDQKRKNGYQGNIMKKGKEKTREEKALENRVKELEKQLKYERLRSDALDTMIKIAEDKFEIPIRKKPGTKQ